MVNSYKTVLSIDPGGTTGIAIRFPNGEIETFVCKTPEELYDFIKQVRENLEQIVIEDFNAETISKYGIYTVRLVGGVTALARVFEIPLKVQLPQMRYPFRVEAQNIVKDRRTVIHERDALSHLLRFEYDNNIGV